VTCGAGLTTLASAWLIEPRIASRLTLIWIGGSLLGTSMEGPDDLAVYERVEFSAHLDEAVGDRRHALYVLEHPSADGAVLARRGREDRWSLSRERPLDSPGTDQLSESELVALLRTAIGVTDLDVEIERLSSFTFAAQIAERYRRGRCLLIGDAAHRMTRAAVPA
jgi:putative polyketide hydroxylase